MAVARDAIVDGGNNGGSTSSLTFSVTTSGSDRLLFVGCVTIAATSTVTGVTYNGVAMSLVGSDTQGTLATYLFKLADPASGANNVVITGSTTGYILAGALSYTGADGTIDAHEESFESAADGMTDSIITVDDNSWVVAFTSNPFPDGPAVAGTGLTRQTFDAAFGDWTLLDSNGAITPAGSYSATASPTTNGHNMVMILATISPAGGGGGGSSTTDGKILIAPVGFS